MSKMKNLKKTLAVFMAALMVMSCWVFTPISFEAEAATNNVDTIKDLSEDYFNTDVTTIFGSFESDDDYISTEDYNAVYHNVLYTDGAVSKEGGGQAVSEKTQYGSSITGSNGVTIRWYHPTATLMYDGDTANLPRLGVAMNTIMYYTGTWSRKSINRLGWVESGGNGFAFNENWRGTDTRLNFQWMWRGCKETMGCTSTVENDKLQDQVSGDSDNHFYANLLKFTDNMSDTEYYREAMPKFGFYGDNDSKGATIYATTTKTIAIINYKPLKTALEKALETYNKVKANPDYYTTESVAKFVELAQALVAAKPNNFVNSSNNDYTGYADAAKAAVDAWNAWSGLEVRQITFTLDFNGGTTTAPATYTKDYGSVFGTVPTPVRTGYQFDGFYLKNNSNIQLKAETVFEEDSTWVAKWTAFEYELSFQYRKADGEWTTDTRSATKYNATVTAPNVTKEITIGDTKYTFTGWDPSFTGTMPAKDTKYIAQYSATTLTADLSKLQEQIARADEVKKSEYYTQKGYTDDYISSLDSAYNAAVNYNKDTTPKSQQDLVDAATETLKNVLDNPTLKVVTVIFKDETGAIVKDGYSTVNWGESVTVPTNPSIDSDMSYHYNFKGWLDYTDAEVAEFCAKVTEDRIFLADFEAEPHSLTTETITSTCTSDGAVKHTCTTCGFSYTESNDDKAHHTWSADKVVVKEATCHSEGIKAKQCTECGVYDKDSIESIDKLTHSYGDWITLVEPSCTGKGVRYKECQNDGCGAREYEVYGDDVRHDWGNKTVVAATCTTAGYEIETCSKCGLTKFTAGDPATGHKDTKTETVGATCTTDGFERTYCADCGYEISRTAIKAKGHDYPETWTVVTEATCGHQGLESRKCPTCKAVEYKITDKLTEHSYDEIVTKKATCTENGEKTCICKECGFSYTETIEAVGHHTMVADPDNSQAATCTKPSITATKCSACGYTEKVVGEALGHDMKQVSEVEATCGQAGYKVMKCSRCEHTYNEFTTQATGNHDFTYETKQEGTTLTVTGKCKNCEAEIETTVQVAEGHSYNNPVITKVPTCQEEGTMKIYCDKKHSADCTAYVEVTLEKNENAHTKCTTAVTPATCTSDGLAVTTCECGKEVAREVIPATKHSYTTKLSEVKATCQTEGSVTLKCADCDATTTVKTDVNPDAHDYQKTSSVSATCTEPAYDVYTCQHDGCDKTYNVYTGTKANGHDWKTTVTQNGNLISVTRTCKTVGCGVSETVVSSYEIETGHSHDFTNAVPTITPATCCQEGKITVKCNDCDYTITINTEKNKDHTDIETLYTEPTCTTPGYVKVLCADCEDVLSETALAALGHDFFGGREDVTTPATCTTDGEKTVHCKHCTETTKVTIPKLGHEYEKVEGGKEATCTSYGYDVYKCKHAGCNDTYNALIEEKGHTFTGATTTYAPTCTEQGYTERYCSACQQTVKYDFVEAKGHEMTEQVVSATCTSQGYTLHKCKRDNCDYEYKDSYTPISDHNYEDIVTLPTCTEKGYTTHKCKNEGCTYSYIDSYVDAKGHDFNNDGVVVEKDGKKMIEHVCNNGCGEKQYEYISGECNHVEVFVKTVAPTCTEEGYDLYKCGICENEIKKNYKEALGHNWDYWTITKHPTETTNGSQERVCKNCGLKETEEIIWGKYYLVTFYNHDGTRLIRPAYYSYGKAAKMPDFTPTRGGDNGYTYTFSGYNFSEAEINCVTKSMAVIAQYEATERVYDVTYVNGDGSVIQTVSGVKYTKITESYTGVTPTKASDKDYTYTFSSWSVNCDPETGTAVATATFAKKQTEESIAEEQSKPGILTRFIEWLKAFFKKIFGIA